MAVAACTTGEQRDAREPEATPGARVAAGCVLADGSTFEILEIRYSAISGTARLSVNGKDAGTGQDCVIIAEERPDGFSWRSWRDHQIHRLSTREEDRARTQAFLLEEMFPAGAPPGKAEAHRK